jgi:hypothetical protein
MSEPCTEEILRVQAGTVLTEQMLRDAVRVLARADVPEGYWMIDSRNRFRPIPLDLMSLGMIQQEVELFNEYPEFIV